MIHIVPQSEGYMEGDGTSDDTRRGENEPIKQHKQERQAWLECLPDLFRLLCLFLPLLPLTKHKLTTSRTL